MARQEVGFYEAPRQEKHKRRRWRSSHRGEVLCRFHLRRRSADQACKRPRWYQTDPPSTVARGFVRLLPAFLLLLVAGEPVCNSWGTACEQHKADTARGHTAQQAAVPSADTVSTAQAEVNTTSPWRQVLDRGLLIACLFVAFVACGFVAGPAVACVGAYATTWVLSRLSTHAHGQDCRRATCIVFSAACATYAGAAAALVAGLFVLGVSRECLWWTPKLDPQKRLEDLVKYVEDNRSRLLMQYAERGEAVEIEASPVDRLMATLKKRHSAQEAAWYAFLARERTKGQNLERIEQIWRMLQEAPGSTPESVAAQGESSSSSAAPGAVAVASDAGVCSGEGGSSSPNWLDSDWGVFEGDRRRLQDVAAFLHAHSADDVTWTQANLKQTWHRLRQRCERSCGTKPSERQLPPGLATLVGYLARCEGQHGQPGEMVAYNEKRSRLKGNMRRGADEYFLEGNWDVAGFISEDFQRIGRSKAVLSGGQALQQHVEAHAQRKHLERDRQWQAEARAKEKEQRQNRAALNPKVPGTDRLRQPEALRALYGASKEAERRQQSVFDRGLEVDQALEHDFVACDYCKEGWLSPVRSELLQQQPKTSTARKMAFYLQDPSLWDKDGGCRICTRCYEEVQKRPRGDDPRPEENCAANDMDIEDTYGELDNLTFFEEEILAPIQPLVRVYTLYSTGLTEMRGHVANWAQNGPQTVREIPCKAKDLNLLLVRRYPRDPSKPQRVPFQASPARLTAALDRLEGKLGTEPHRGFKANALHTTGQQAHLKRIPGERCPAHHWEGWRD